MFYAHSVDLDAQPLEGARTILALVVKTSAPRTGIAKVVRYERVPGGTSRLYGWLVLWLLLHAKPTHLKEEQDDLQVR